jgi:FAD/FMN-containing dehydrogenase
MKRRTFCASALAAATCWPLARAQAVASDTPAAGGAVAASGPAGKQISLSASDVADLRASLRGHLLLPGEGGYDSARRIWNGAFDRKPALIARCAGAADVSQAVNFGRDHGLLIAVRGGGHSLSGQSVCDGGLMIDLSPMQSVRVDPVARIARVEPGVLLADLDREAQAFGLATPAGTVSHTGAAGLTLGGGFGRIARKFGLACDNLIAADVVPANGKFVRTGEQENADLLWGLRGGGGNFGVVTSFEYRLHPLNPTVFGGVLIFPFADARALLTYFADFAADAPDELYTDAALTFGPGGQKVLVFDVSWCGSVESGERTLKTLREMRKPLMDRLGPVSYVALQASGDEANRAGRGYYEKSGFIGRITPALIDTAVGLFENAGLPNAAIAFVHHGGAISRVKPGATAFVHREAKHTVLIGADWDEPGEAEANMAWARQAFKAFEPQTDGFYVNTMAADDSDRRVRGTYGDNYARLVALKNKYDPTNLFRLNANVKPSV